MSQTEKIKRLLGEQQVHLNAIEGVRKTVKKLPLDKRTAEHLKKVWEGALDTFALFEWNHESLRELGAAVPEEYGPKMEQTREVVKALNDVILQFQPGAVGVWPPGEPPGAVGNEPGAVGGTAEMSQKGVTRKSPPKPPPTLHPIHRKKVEVNTPLTGLDGLFNFTPEKATSDDQLNMGVGSSGKANTDDLLSGLTGQWTNGLGGELQNEAVERARKVADSMKNADGNSSTDGMRATNDGLNGTAFTFAPSDVMQMMKMMMEKNSGEMQQLLNSFQNKAAPDRGYKAPQVELPKFEGDYKGFKAFKDVFKSIIDRSRLSPIEKFTLLRGRLSGAALRAIDHLTVTDENYEVAWATLHRTFDSEMLQISFNIEAILSNKKPDRNNPESMLRHMQVWASAMNNLDGLKVTADQVFAYLIIESFDAQTKARFEDKRGSNRSMPTRQFLVEFQETEHNVLLKQHWGKVNKETNGEKKVQPPPQKKVETTRTHAAFDATERRAMKCYVCEGSHRVIECKKFREAENKVEFLIANRLCIYCAAHRWSLQSQCNRKKMLKCDKCELQHITEVCPGKREETRAHLCFHAETEELKSELPSTVVSTLIPSRVLLPTAIATLVGKQYLMPVRSLIDQGSESCYITENLVQSLRLKKTRVNVRVLGLNGALAATITGMVTMKVKTGDVDVPMITVPAFVVPRITSHLPANKVEIEWKAEDFLELADPTFFEPSHVGVLFGSNIIATLMLEGLKKRDGFLLQKTLFGWIVSGCASGARNVPAMVSSFITFGMEEGEEEMENDQEMPSKEKASEAEFESVADRMLAMEDESLNDQVVRF